MTRGVMRPRLRALYLNEKTREYIAEDVTGEYFVGVLDEPIKAHPYAAPDRRYNLPALLVALGFFGVVGLCAYWFWEAAL